MPRVFLSYSRKDGDEAGRLYKTLIEAGVDVWFDQVDLIPGMRWGPAIRKAVREAKYFVALLSRKSVSGRGFRNTELHEALEILKQYPESERYFIPVRLDNCKMPDDELDEIHRVDLFPDWDEGIAALLPAIKGRTTTTSAKRSGRKVSPTSYEYRVALVDLDLGLTNMEDFARTLNRVQEFFQFTAPELPPLKKAVVTIDGIKNLATYKVPESYITDSSLPVDFVACFTRYPLAYREAKKIHPNYFAISSDTEERFTFISADELNEFTREAGCAFEQGMAYLLAGQLVTYFSAYFSGTPDMDYHDQTRGCVMDFCEVREDLIRGLKKREFCKACFGLLKPPQLKKAAVAILSANF